MRSPIRARKVFPDGVDAALELVGTPTLPDTLRSVRMHGVVCFTGMLSNEWIVRDFYPTGYLPRGVRLAAYGGDADDLPAAVLRDFLDAVAAGTAVVPIAKGLRLRRDRPGAHRHGGQPVRREVGGQGV